MCDPGRRVFGTFDGKEPSPCLDLVGLLRAVMKGNIFSGFVFVKPALDR